MPAERLRPTPSPSRALLLAGPAAAPPSIFAFLFEPYLLVVGFFLFIMASLGFAQPTIHSASMALRWPVMGVVCAIGLGLVVARGLSRQSAAVGIFAVLLGWTLFSTTYSMDKWYTLQRSLSLGLLFGATMLGVTAYCRSLREVTMLTDMLWCLGAVLVVGGLIFRAGADTVDQSERYGGLYDRATGAGTYGAIFLPIAFYQVRWRFRGVMQFVGWMVIGLLFLQVLLSAARAALVISTLTSLALAFRYYGRKALVVGVVLALLAPVPLLLSTRLVERFQERSRKIVRAESISTFTGRLDRWKFGWEQFQKKPLLGFGLGVSRTLAGYVDPQRFNLEPGEVFNLHSDQIETMVDLGVVGGALFTLFWIAVAIPGVGSAIRARGTVQSLSLTYLGCVFYVYVDTFMHGGFFAAGGGVSSFSWTLIALLLVVAKLSAVATLPLAASAKGGSVRIRETFAGAMPKENAAAENLKAAGRWVDRRDDLRRRLPSARRLVRQE